MEKVTYFESLKKIDEIISSDDLYKQLYVEVIKNSIEKRDYIGLIDKTASMFEINRKDAQMLLFDISRNENLEEAWADIGAGLYTYLKVITITYGEAIQEIRKYATSKDKLLLSESFLSNYDTKVGLDIKRVDGEFFYFELNFNSTISFTSQIINLFREHVLKNKISHHDREMYDLALQLRAEVALLANSFERERDAKGGDDSDGRIID